MYKAPSLAKLSQDIRAAFKSEVQGSDPWIWPNTFYIVGKVFAGLMRTLYQRLEYIHLQRFAATSSVEFLDAHGFEIGLSRKYATLASGTVTFTTDLANSVPAGTRLVRGDGAIFTTDSDVTPISSPGTVSIRAAEEGVKGNTPAAATLTLETPIAGVGAFTVDSNGLTGGADAETDASYRARILEKKRNPPHGGSPGEYIIWARQVAGVSRVFVQRATPEPGSVTILFMMDDSIYSGGIPGAGDVARVKAYLESVAPASANIVVTAPTAVPVPVTITALTPNTAVVREAVLRELRAMFRRRSQPGTPDADFTFSVSWINEAISIATGETSHTISAPSADVDVGDGEVAVMGTVTFP